MAAEREREGAHDAADGGIFQCRETAVALCFLHVAAYRHNNAQGASMRTTIRKIGNSQGVLIPKPMLAETGLEVDVDISVENGAIVLRPAS